MATTKTFTVAGVSTSSSNGETKIRFANDLVKRVKVLTKCGDYDIDIRDLPNPMLKPDATEYLMGIRDTFTKEGAIAIEDANDRYHSEPTAKRKTKKKAEKVGETTTVTAKPGKVKITSSVSGDQDKKDKRNARRRELRALKKAEVEGVLANVE